ncbi:hypothetical protein AB0M02_45805 [Actinoplanes sp. NPDC051861]|uniref:hypothetical protein n=1 Tax=Actinoplanes sp. NPDC051861 TaxID=3155170 RepID=UPI00342A0BF5
MSSTIVHQPRVVWDAARAFVRAAGGPRAAEFAHLVRDLLGPDVQEAFTATRDHLAAESARTGGDRGAFDLEAGKWRIRLDELLRARPELTEPVRELTGRGFES